MMKIKNLKNTLVSTTLALLVLNACSTADITSGIIDRIISKGYYYVDKAIAGVDYVCGSESGVTNADGSFNFEEGKECLFSIGGLVLTKVQASDLNNNTKLFEYTPTVVKVLQTLDQDGNVSNGIDINTNIVSTVIEESNITSLSEIELDTALLDTLVEDIKAIDESYHGTVSTDTEVEEQITTARQVEVEENNNENANENTNEQAEVNNNENANEQTEVNENTNENANEQTEVNENANENTNEQAEVNTNENANEQAEVNTNENANEQAEVNTNENANEQAEVNTNENANENINEQTEVNNNSEDND